MKALLRKRRTRRGLTLIELVVVLAILAALAGLVLPLAGTYLEKAHASSAASNFKEVSKVVQQYNTLTREMPNGLDSLLEDASTVYAANPAASLLNAGNVTADQVVALNAVGIDTTFFHDGGGESATFDSTGTSQTIGAAAFATGPGLTQLQEQIALDINATEVVVFGFGHNTNLIGEWMQEAPYHFPEEGNPNVNYNRFGLVFDVTNAPEAADFVGVVSFHDGEFIGPLEPLAEFFGE